MGIGAAKGPLFAGAAAAIYVVVVIPALLVGTVLMASQSSAIGITTAAAVECSPYQFADYGKGGGTQEIGDEKFHAEQLANAQTIVAVAVQRKLPKRAAVLALATAMVESELRNLNYGDRDSLGLFQQRPSQGWGSPEQILNPVYAAGKFYDHLVALPGWQTMPPGAAEQAVQRSGFPDRYAPREPAAAGLTERYWQGPDNPTPPPVTDPVQQVDFSASACPDKGRGKLRDDGKLDPKKLPPDFTLPTDPKLAAAVTYALAQLGKRYVWGAEGPDAFDCSGLMQAAWAHAGVAISRTTSTQVHDGVAVGSLSQVQPGDLVFIPGADGTPANPGHVGMYVGNGYMVDAYDDDHGVILTTLESWVPKVVAIRRVAVGNNGQPPPGGDPRV
ncbi:C40 family peptidase [Amycolatopsis sp. cg9]|uniref:C40 family peptidase n=1 Tax=Amycolatopsis sp. cg9 TaxID=3238801 RepID=UPI0035267E97